MLEPGLTDDFPVPLVRAVECDRRAAVRSAPFAMPLLIIGFGDDGLDPAGAE